jgi:hypothetical protein
MNRATAPMGTLGINCAVPSKMLSESCICPSVVARVLR